MEVNIELMCTTAGMFQNWSSAVIPNGRVIQSTGENDHQNHTQTVNNTVFTFYRLSGPNSLPLMSRLLVGDDLNGTAVTCVDLVTSNSSSTVIITNKRRGGSRCVPKSYVSTAL